MSVAIQTPYFELGEICLSVGALHALTDQKLEPGQIVQRHAMGDWGVVSDNDANANEQSIRQPFGKVVSAYIIGCSRILVVTDEQRQATTILLSSDY